MRSTARMRHPSNLLEQKLKTVSRFSITLRYKPHMVSFNSRVHDLFSNILLCEIKVDEVRKNILVLRPTQPDYRNIKKWVHASRRSVYTRVRKVYYLLLPFGEIYIILMVRFNV